MAHRASCRKSHANMTPEQREQRRKRQRLYNKTPSRREAMKVTTNCSREVQKHTLNSESIAMENRSLIQRWSGPMQTHLGLMDP